MNKQRSVITILAASILAVAMIGAGIGIGIVASNQNSDGNGESSSTTPESSVSASATPGETQAAPVAEKSTLEANLAYLIEEEKLAHDVYTVLGEMWGSKTMMNIVNSEDTHESQVLAVLANYGFADPRSSEVGVFVNAKLQDLYDTLIAQGSQSERAAMEVGVIIEETDIRDLQIAIDQIDNADIDAVLTSLLNASENHLAAFSRQR
jgi:hypothetical protein